jgi:competence ComEA-like helix-hairpin-helix protein
MGFFTPQERFIILFLIFLLVLSSSVYLYKLNHPSFAPAYLIEDFHKIIVEQNTQEKKIDYTVPEESMEYEIKKTEVFNGKINLNTASKSSLMRIPGIGPVYAQRIIEYREKHNGFKTTSEIKNISGIGEKKCRLCPSTENE